MKGHETNWRLILGDKAIERRLIIFLCLLAMVRVFLLNAAFPIFNPVDEVQHFDTIVRYAEGDVYDSGVTDYSLNLWSAKIQIIYATPEYLHQELKDKIPTFRKMNRPDAPAIVDSLRQRIADSLPNYEVHSPPIYYFLAGQWLNIGKLIFSNDGFLVYWLRFMNVFYYGLLLGGTYLFCKYFYPEDRAVRIGVPMLLAVFPNTIFYSLNNDVFSPLFCTLALFMTLRICTGQRTILTYALTGLAIASTLLVKLTNMPTFFVCTAIIAVFTYRLISTKDIAAKSQNLVALFTAMLAPLLLWMGWNLTVLGDLLGTEDKVRFLGWTRKPLLAWFGHPIFSISGWKSAAENFHMLIYTLWRGDLVNWPDSLDAFFTISSVVFVIAVCARLYSTRGRISSQKSLFSAACLAICILYIAFIVISSIQFDFGKCFSPSQANPYFNKGRLIIGCLVPFLIIYIEGLEYILSLLKLKKYSLHFIGIICLIILIATPIVTRQTFSSQWNWFHYF